MKKVDFIVTKQNDVDIVRYDLNTADVYDDNAADKAEQLPNVIPFQYSDSDGKRSITSYVREKMTLEALYKRTLNKKQVLSVLRGLVSAFEIGTQGIPISYIVKDPSYIYVNEENFAVKCILVPVKQDVMPLAEIPVFFRNVVSRMIYDESDTDNYVAKLFTVINSNDFTISRLGSLVDELLEAMGLFVSRENGLTGMPDSKPQRGQTPNQVKVNKLGVMNNIQNANRQMMMGQQMQGQPMPQMQPRPMGQPMPQMQPRPMGQPMPQMQPQPMGQQMPKPPVQPMSQPMGQPMPKPPVQSMPQPMGQPMPKPPVQPMPQPMGGQPQSMGQPMPKPPVQPVPQPMGGQPQPMGQQMPKPPVQPMPQPMGGQPQPMGQQMPKPPVQPMPQPMGGQPQPPVQPMPQPQPISEPTTQPTTQLKPQPQPMPQPQPKPQPIPEPTNQLTQELSQPQQPEEITHGNLVGQMGSKPIPHIVRKRTGEVINITKSEFSIGKSNTKADYAIEDNSAISRVHCIIVQRDGVNYIKDNNSTNHTYLNGVELAPGKEQLLKNKTLIQMGDEEFTFYLRKNE